MGCEVLQLFQVFHLDNGVELLRVHIGDFGLLGNHLKQVMLLLLFKDLLEQLDLMLPLFGVHLRMSGDDIITIEYKINNRLFS